MNILLRGLSVLLENSEALYIINNNFNNAISLLCPQAHLQNQPYCQFCQNFTLWHHPQELHRLQIKQAL